MKLLTTQLTKTNKMLAKKVAIIGFLSGALVILAATVTAGTTDAKALQITPGPTATVAPMVVGQPMRLHDDAGNTVIVMQGSTYYLFPKPEETKTPK